MSKLEAKLIELSDAAYQTTIELFGIAPSSNVSWHLVVLTNGTEQGPREFPIAVTIVEQDEDLYVDNWYVNSAKEEDFDILFECIARYAQKVKPQAILVLGNFPPRVRIMLENRFQMKLCSRYLRSACTYGNIHDSLITGFPKIKLVGSNMEILQLLSSLIAERLFVDPNFTAKFETISRLQCAAYYDEDKPIGVVFYNWSDGYGLGPIVGGIYVLPEYRGRGIGTSLGRYATTALGSVGIEYSEAFGHASDGFLKKIYARELCAIFYADVDSITSPCKDQTAESKGDPGLAEATLSFRSIATGAR